jgi:hypothetical protein
MLPEVSVNEEKEGSFQKWVKQLENQGIREHLTELAVTTYSATKKQCSLTCKTEWKGHSPALFATHHDELVNLISCNFKYKHLVGPAGNSRKKRGRKDNDSDEVQLC